MEKMTFYFENNNFKLFLGCLRTKLTSHIRKRMKLFRVPLEGLCIFHILLFQSYFSFMFVFLEPYKRETIRLLNKGRIDCVCVFKHFNNFKTKKKVFNGTRASQEWWNTKMVAALGLCEI